MENVRTSLADGMSYVGSEGHLVVSIVDLHTLSSVDDQLLGAWNGGHTDTDGLFAMFIISVSE